MIRWLVTVGSGLVLLVGVVLLVGMALPVSHVASVSDTVPASPEAVWTVITDVEAFPSWRRGVEEVERLPDRDGRPAWREVARTGAMTLEVVRSRPDRLWVTRIADPDLPFGGTWTFELEPEGPVTRLTITENGQVYNPFFRFMARFVFGHEATARAYLEDLRSRLVRDEARAERADRCRARPGRAVADAETGHRA